MNSWKVAQALLDHIRATQGAHHAMLDLEKRSQTDLDKLHALYQQLVEKAPRAVCATIAGKPYPFHAHIMNAPS